MKTLKMLATGAAVMALAASSAFAQMDAPAKKGASEKGASDVPAKCRTLSEPERAQCIRDDMSAKESSKVEPSGKGDKMKGSKSDTPAKGM